MGLAGLKVDSLGHTMATMQFSWPTLSNSGFWSWATSLAYRDFFFFSPKGAISGQHMCVHPSSFLWFTLVLVDSEHPPRPALGGVGSGVLSV